MERRELDSSVEGLMNPVLDCIERRSSTRLFSDSPVTDAERRAILHAATRAPSAGAMMFYSIVTVDDLGLRRDLCHACDDQPLMLKAPLWLLFVADVRKWWDLYDQVGCLTDPSLVSSPEHARRSPGMGDLMLACQDAAIAAQTAVIAAESLGIGSCYIGDCVEHGEQVAALLGLPAGTLPLSLLVMGHKRNDAADRPSVSCTVDDQPAAAGDGLPSAPGESRGQTPHPVAGLVMADRYRVPTPEQRAEAIAELDAKFTPHAVANGAPAGGRVRKLYRRKHTSDFMAEMNRSAQWRVDRWTQVGPAED